MTINKQHRGGKIARRRRGAAALDYMLLLCIVMPLAAFCFVLGPRILGLAYDLLAIIIGWPFM